MNISSDRLCSCTRVNFGARNKNIRKVDDIRRSASLEFPLMSYTYVRKFYHVAADRNNKYNSTLKKTIALADKIYKVRDINKKKSAKDEVPYLSVLKSAKIYKVGNCSEASKIALCALAAKGYNDSRIVKLGVEIAAVNKNTGRCEHIGYKNVDHVFVLTSCEKNSKEKKDLVIVDPWMGFTDSYSGAIRRYKEAYWDSDIVPLLNNVNKCIKYIAEEEYGHYDPENYEIKTKLYFKNYDKYNSEEYEKLGLYLNESDDFPMFKR